MNAMTDLERELRLHFDHHADPTVLDAQLDRITERVAEVRQRPGWMLLERWLPMSTISTRVAAAPRITLRVVAVALLILALAASLVLVVGAMRHPVPSPFGVAANGLIAYADGTGAINVGDSTTGSSRSIVRGPGNDRPIFSPDGTRVAFVHTASDGSTGVVVVRADGSAATNVAREALGRIGYLTWTPDSASIVVDSGDGHLKVFDATHPGSPLVLAMDVSAGADDYNARPADLYQPPDGRRVLFIRTGPHGPEMVVSDRDGSNVRTLIDATHGDVVFTYLGSPEWSPDGSMIAFTGATSDVLQDSFTWVMNADGSGLRSLNGAGRPINESNPTWSPDGSQIAVQRWFIDTTTGTQEVRPVTVIDVATGHEVERGPTPQQNGINGWGWSPDGASIMEFTTEDALLLANVATGQMTTVPWTVSSPPTWQRLAP